MGLAVFATFVYAQAPTRFTSLAVDGVTTVGSLKIGTAAVATPQIDTNATTVATAYTPSAIGQVLIGGAGTGTNAVWISKGLTTNDWIRVAP